MSKPRINYTEFQQQQMRYAPESFSMLIERVIRDVAANPAMRQYNTRFLYHLRLLQEMPIGKKPAAALRKSDYIEHCKERRAGFGKYKPVAKPTAMHDFVKIRGILRHASANWGDDWDEALAAMEAAKHFLTKAEIIGKGNIRTRIATEDELDRLLSYFDAENKRGRNEVDMVPVILFGLVSTRRRGEVCRILRSDIDWEKMTYMVRDMKHPTKKVGNHGTFALLPELVEIIKTLPVIEGEDRLFPYNGNVVGQKYCAAKKALGIVDLRLHDNRRAAITKWLAILKSPHRVKLISGHKTTQMIERVYDATDPALINQDLAELGVSSVLAAHRMPA